MELSFIFTAFFPLLVNLVSILPIMLGAILLPARFNGPKLLFILACVFLGLSFLNYFLVFILELFGTSAASANFSQVYLQFSMIFQAFHFAGLVCVGFGIWKLASLLSEGTDVSDDVLNEL